ncbi:MAG TPA: hypothetical protein VFI25_15740 [Planctomycetota bacterium]|jgi:hypothetical protein|nr:hypothetical protein [Planctomycetota bacterium]
MGGALRDAVGGLARAFGRTRILWLVFLLNFVPALAVGIPFAGALDRSMGLRRDAPDLVAEYGGDFDLDFRLRNAPLLEGLRGSLSVLAFVSFLLGAFVAGGWIGVFHEPKGTGSVQAFFRWGGRQWARFLRVSALTLVAVHVVGVFTHGKGWELLLDLASGVRKIEDLPDGKTAVLAEWWRGAAYVLLLAFLFTAADYARISIVEADRRSALLAWLHGIAFVARHPLRTGLLLGFYNLAEGLLLAAATLLLRTGSEHVRGGFGALGLFLLMQATILGRVGLRGARYAGELAVYRSSQAEAAPLQAPVLATRLAGV